jgi:nuclear pore complex protein Nup205
VRKLNQKLDEARPWILALTGLPGPNEEDKKFIASSPISAPNGVEVPVKDELLATTNTIADNLQISHLLAAVLALHAVQSRRRFPSRSDVEISIYILHEALQALLDVVQELLRLTVGSDAIAGEPWDDLRIWVENLLDEKGVNGYLADGAVDQIDAMQTRLSTLVRTQASGAAMDLLNFRVEAMRTEQNRLAGILQIIAESGLLKSSQVVKMVKWLKKSAKPDAIVAAVYAAFCAATQPLEALDPEDPRVDTVSAYMGHSKFILVVCNIVVSLLHHGSN